CFCPRIFLNDSAYKEILESSVNYNTRLCIERRLRLPFFDTQTGVAQNHASLYMNRRQRMPGLLPGQIYTYPRLLLCHAQRTLNILGNRWSNSRVVNKRRKKWSNFASGCFRHSSKKILGL
ncbi:unnamed protein product, partial [Acanthoscelides obtectus]